MNKKILLSLSTIAAVAAIAIGGTMAYFSDTETSTGNTFTAGTIDISVDDQNPWTDSYDIGDLKPGETGYINFKIKNVGTNPANISKSLYNFTDVQTTGETYDCANIGVVSSEPECVAEQANSNTRIDDVETQLIYDLSVKVYADDNETTPIWWQTIYKDSDNKTLTAVYGNTTTATNFVNLGMIPAGGHMDVTQSYKFNPGAGNEYQGDGLKFDMEIKADQMAQGEGITSVALENKDDTWNIIQGDNIEGTLSYKTKGAMFDYNFTGTVKTPSTSYTLFYVGPSGNYPYSGQVILGTQTASGNSISLSGSVDTGSITNGKIWLIPSAVYPTGWDQDNTLFETGLINYTKN